MRVAFMACRVHGVPTLRGPGDPALPLPVQGPHLRWHCPATQAMTSVVHAMHGHAGGFDDAGSQWASQAARFAAHAVRLRTGPPQQARASSHWLESLGAETYPQGAQSESLVQANGSLLDCVPPAEDEALASALPPHPDATTNASIAPATNSKRPRPAPKDQRYMLRGHPSRSVGAT